MEWAQGGHANGMDMVECSFIFTQSVLISDGSICHGPTYETKIFRIWDTGKHKNWNLQI
jgi:hypothetical protein